MPIARTVYVLDGRSSVVAEVDRAEAIRFYTRDGVKLAGTLTLPPGASSTDRSPAILLCQGLSGRKDLVLPHIAGRFAEAGLASLAFDYRGYGESEGIRGWVDPPGRVEDALYACAYLCQRPEIDPTRVAVYGLSLGGPIAICVAERETRIRAVVAVSSPGNGERLLRSLRTEAQWTEFQERLLTERRERAVSGRSTLVDVREIFPFSPRLLAKYSALASGSGTSTMAPSPAVGPAPSVYLASAEAILDFRPEDAVRRLESRPLLLIAGENDDVATHDHVRALFDPAPGPRELVMMPDCDHVDLDTGEGLTEQASMAARWLVSQLGSGVTKA
jgi:pimeloyl-ACP methyl ester carboxylesterase